MGFRIPPDLAGCVLDYYWLKPVPKKWMCANCARIAGAILCELNIWPYIELCVLNQYTHCLFFSLTPIGVVANRG